jgi:hypothetical protein
MIVLQGMTLDGDDAGNSMLGPVLQTLMRKVDSHSTELKNLSDEYELLTKGERIGK